MEAEAVWPKLPAYVLRIRTTDPHPWMTANDRGHWAVRYRRGRWWRHTAATLALQQRIPTHDRVRVQVEFKFRATRRRDAENWAPTVKAIVDGLVDARVVPDDNVTHMVGPEPLISADPPPPKTTGEAVVRIWPMS